MTYKTAGAAVPADPAHVDRAGAGRLRGGVVGRLAAARAADPVRPGQAAPRGPADDRRWPCRPLVAAGIVTPAEAAVPDGARWRRWPARRHDPDARRRHGARRPRPDPTPAERGGTPRDEEVPEDDPGLTGSSFGFELRDDRARRCRPVHPARGPGGAVRHVGERRRVHGAAHAGSFDRSTKSGSGKSAAAAAVPRPRRPVADRHADPVAPRRRRPARGLAS